MRARKTATVLAVVAALFGATPAVAQAAECGATPEQWVGTYTGTQFDDISPTTPLRVTVVDDGAGLAVTTVDNTTTYPPYGHATTTLNRLRWHIQLPHPINPARAYIALDKTCSGGAVTSFSGVVEFYVWPDWWYYSDFELTRT